eukprot:1159828-Pelagomonas_calceolata.AAC.12
MNNKQQKPVALHPIAIMSLAQALKHYIPSSFSSFPFSPAAFHCLQLAGNEPFLSIKQAQHEWSFPKQMDLINRGAPLALTDPFFK